MPRTLMARAPMAMTFSSKPSNQALALGGQPRLEAAVALARHRDLQRPVPAPHRLAPRAAALGPPARPAAPRRARGPGCRGTSGGTCPRPWPASWTTSRRASRTCACPSPTAAPSGPPACSSACSSRSAAGSGPSPTPQAERPVLKLMSGAMTRAAARRRRAREPRSSAARSTPANKTSPASTRPPTPSNPPPSGPTRHRNPQHLSSVTDAVLDEVAEWSEPAARGLLPVRRAIAGPSAIACPPHSSSTRSG